MTSQQGSLDLLKEPVAQTLLQSKTPACFAYQWIDGTPRVVPIGFHWNGEELVLGTPVDAPKLKALRDGQHVALCIDTDSMPYKVLEIRGRVRLDEVQGIAPAYELMTLRTLGDEAGHAWLTNLAPICPRMARVYISPTWVGLLDFETRFPSALERAMEAAGAAPSSGGHGTA
ncbi:pyridoxamine 5'-phosphate oxidase family protein [Phycicoccus ginsengisoli]